MDDLKDLVRAQVRAQLEVLAAALNAADNTEDRMALVAGVLVHLAHYGGYGEDLTQEAMAQAWDRMRWANQVIEETE